MLSAREIAFQALQNWEFKNFEIQQSLEPLFTLEISEREKALAQELALGVLRHKRTLDEIIRQYSKKHIRKMPYEVRNVLRLGLYQLLHLDRIPEHAAVNESVELAKIFCKGGSTKFVNALLREFLRRDRAIEYPHDPIQALALSTSYPLELVQRWVKLWGVSKTAKLCKAGNERPQLMLRVNTLKTTRELLLIELEQEGIQAVESTHPLSIRGLGGKSLTRSEAFKKGLFQVQDETMLKVIDEMDLERGLKVLDVCSAPGTKTTAIAERMGDEGWILAVDRSFPRILPLVENMDRLGLQSIRILVADATQIHLLCKNYFDRILVDVPCSNTGVLAKRVEARWRFSLTDLRRLATLQGSLLGVALNVLKPGGILIYSTCSLDPIENEEVVRKVLYKGQNLRLIGQETIFPSPKSSGGYWAKIQKSNIKDQKLDKNK